jgi:hypothetical protein
MPEDNESELFQTGGAGHHPKDAFRGAGKNPQDVGVTTRHAVRERDGGDADDPVDPPRITDGRGTFPIGTERADDDAPTDVVDFAPRDATPPTTTP